MRRPLARRDASALSRARHYSSSGNCLDHSQWHHTERGWPLHESHPLNDFGNLFLERRLGTARPRPRAISSQGESSGWQRAAPTQSSVAEPLLQTPSSYPQSEDSPPRNAVPPARARRMSTRNRFLFFLVAWLIVLMPFLFWWNTWFGRQLSDKQLGEYLNDQKHPRHIQHALVQLSGRMQRGDANASRWYPQVVTLATSSVEEVRNTDAWVMGQDTSGAGFHETLLKMLGDSSALVRGNAALSLVRFGDASGRPQIVALLQPAQIAAPVAGRVVDADQPGTAIRQGGLVAKLQPADASQHIVEIRSPIPGRIRSVTQTGGSVSAGTEIDRKSTRLNSSHQIISYAVFCLKKKTKRTDN